VSVEFFYAFAVAYLAIGFYTAWRSPAPRIVGFGGQVKVAAAVLGIALFWPNIYRTALGGDDSFVDR
jgi:hypothetical protein